MEDKQAPLNQCDICAANYESDSLLRDFSICPSCFAAASERELAYYKGIAKIAAKTFINSDGFNGRK